MCVLEDQVQLASGEYAFLEPKINWKVRWKSTPENTLQIYCPTLMGWNYTDHSICYVSTKDVKDPKMEGLNVEESGIFFSAGIGLPAPVNDKLTLFKPIHEALNRIERNYQPKIYGTIAGYYKNLQNLYFPVTTGYNAHPVPIRVPYWSKDVYFPTMPVDSAFSLDYHGYRLNILN